MRDLLLCCPKCGGVDIEYIPEDEDWGTETVSRKVGCGECEFEWWEVYRFVMNETLDCEELFVDENGKMID
jgi:hypothetical protein